MPNPFQPAVPLEYRNDIDAGVIARFFNSVYAWMAAGLAITATVAWFVSTHPQIQTILRGPAVFIIFIAQLALVWVVSSAINRIGATAATALFLLYAALNGVVFSILLQVYAGALIATAFVITAGMFAATSLYGFVTKRDLTSLGAYLFMGLIGIIIASVVSMFYHPTWLTVAINYAGVFIFIGLTAWDTQRLKTIALQTQNNPALAARLSISGALALYLDFLNLFLFILSILSNGERRR